MTEHDWAIVIITSIGGVLTFVGGHLLLDAARKWRRSKPSVVLQFDQVLVGCIIDTPQGWYDNWLGQPVQKVRRDLRVQVTNTANATAERCKAHLVGIDRKKNDVFVACSTDSILLHWDCDTKNEWVPVDLPTGITRYIDVVSTLSNEQYFWIGVKDMPTRYFDLLREEATYRLKLMVSGDNLQPVHVNLVFEWSGVWDKYSIHREVAALE